MSGGRGLVILVERVYRCKKTQLWLFMDPVDPYFATTDDLDIWKLFTDFCTPKTSAQLASYIIGSPILDHADADHVDKYYLGHRGCCWHNGYQALGYSDMKKHINSGLPLHLVHE